LRADHDTQDAQRSIPGELARGTRGGTVPGAHEQYGPGCRHRLRRDFALAKDRAVALQQFIPGTEDYYYYHALHALNTGAYDAALANFKPWIERHGHTARVTEIQVRHALLTYEKNPKGSLDFLNTHLGLRFDHQRETVGAIPQLPTVLDQKQIDRGTLKANSFARWVNLENFEDAALDWLATEGLGWQAPPQSHPAPATARLAEPAQSSSTTT